MEASMVKSFRDLLVWQKAMDLADAVYSATAGFPRDEMFGLRSQVRRAAVSIPSNIAEGRAAGAGRFLHHIRIALGSEAELQTQVELALRRSYLQPDRARALLNDASEVGRMLHALRSGLEARQAGIRTAGITVLWLLGFSAGLLA
jgi:four helix bundle protein